MEYGTPNSVGMARLKQVLINDKHFNPERLNAILSNDAHKLLNNYFELAPEQVAADIAFDEHGNYIIRIKAVSNRVKIMGILP
ncbi:MAG: hypothetical protein FWE53_02125 [Firmicutes bacterium]|nr:hypothetical protein [Bacillota bacterium]